MPQFLFVYGTLLAEFEKPVARCLQRDGTLIGDGVLTHACLYDIGRYPGLILCQDQGSTVWGRLYQLFSPQKTLHELDAYEQCSPDFPAPHEYIRCLKDVTTKDGRLQTAWVYIYNHSIAGKQQIMGGNYLEYSGKVSS